MIEHNDIWSELKDLSSPLADMPRHMPYCVPEDYFDHLTEALTRGVVDCQGEDVALHYSKAMPFDIPPDYFAALPDQLAEAAIRQTGAGQNSYFGVPDNYFEGLPQLLLKAVKNADHSLKANKAIPFRPQWQKKALQWAAAAVLIMGISIGSYTYMHPSSPDARAARALAKLDREVIDRYISQHVDEFDTDMLESSLTASGVDFDASVSRLNEQEILDYLDGTGPVDTPTLD